MGLTSRISKQSSYLINEMVSITGKTKIEVIEEALKLYCHYERMKLVNDAYAELRQNKKAWEEEEKEREELEGTMSDGLEEE